MKTVLYFQFSDHKITPMKQSKISSSDIFPIGLQMPARDAPILSFNTTRYSS